MSAAIIPNIGETEIASKSRGMQELEQDLCIRPHTEGGQIQKCQSKGKKDSRLDQLLFRPKTCNQ